MDTGSNMLRLQLGLIGRGQMNVTFSSEQRAAMIERLSEGMAVYEDLLAKVRLRT